MSVQISDHALVRFLERAGGLDVEAVRSTLAASLDRSVRAAGALGAREYQLHVDGLIYVVRNGVVTTILSNRGLRG